jgi:hypothetical protein
MDNHNQSKQKSMACIVGAMVHELNNPLQGIVSLLSVHAKESSADDSALNRILQIQAGVTRLARIVEGFSVVCENLPHPPEDLTVATFADRLVSEFSTRNRTAAVIVNCAPETMVHCLAPELIRLIVETFTIHGQSGESICIQFDQSGDAVTLACEQGRENSGELGAWRSLKTQGELSGLPMMVAEIARLGENEAEFRFDHVRLRGIRLTFLTLMR